MPINRNALIRYKTIDRLLRGGRQATLDELIDSCSDALLDYCGNDSVSRRTLQHDLQEMRYSEALGYYAPIVVVGKKFYTYSDTGYSITDVPLSANDMLKLTEAVDVLKQMSAFSAFGGVEDVVNRLEDHVASMRLKAEQVILLECNEQLRGLKHITPLHDAISEKMPVAVAYKTFNSAEPVSFCFSPYILKEYNNRWFVLGKRHEHATESDNVVTTLALDRIEALTEAPRNVKYVRPKSFRPREYFRDMIGVSRSLDSVVEHIEFTALAGQVPYIRTKPLHSSQKEVGCLADGSILFSIDVIVNKELEQRLLSYGDCLTVLSPPSLVERIKLSIANSCRNYGITT